MARRCDWDPPTFDLQLFVRCSDGAELRSAVSRVIAFAGYREMSKDAVVDALLDEHAELGSRRWETLVPVLEEAGLDVAPEALDLLPFSASVRLQSTR